MKLPTALFAKRSELMLTENVRGKTIRIRGGLNFGVSEDVYFAMGLFERLANFVALQPYAPRADGFRRKTNRMPEPNARFSSKPIERTILNIDKFSIDSAGERR